MTDITVVVLAITGILVVALAILRLRHVSLPSLLFGLVGAMLGLLLGALASVPLSKLPEPFGNLLPVVVTVILTLVLMGVAISRRHTLPPQLAWLSERGSRPVEPAVEPAVSAPEPRPQAEDAADAGESEPGKLPPILVDTSVIIDGRIADIAAAGFVPGRLVVPRFVLAELQNIADSDDAMRRGRGRRGLDVLNNLRDLPGVGIEVIDDDVSGIREVDAKLVALAQRFGCNVLTTDYNLNRVAQIQGVRVLNVNELSNAIRPVVLPGEELLVRVVQPGKERNQGVGYLPDGTMIVVENGDKLIGQEVATEVTRVFQTVAGKMIFATPRKPSGAAANPADSNAKPAEATAPSNSPDRPGQADQRTGNDRRGRHGRGRKPSGTVVSPSSNGHTNPNGNAQNSKSAAPVNLEDRVIAAANDTPSEAPDRRPGQPTRPTDRA